MNERRIKNLFKRFRNLPVHPQWLISRTDQSMRKWIASVANGTVLDIGCAGGSIAAYLNGATEYIGLDYPQTAIGWYKTRPKIFGDAAHLPFRDGSFDTVLLLDVLEHIPDSDAALAEACRVMKQGGTLIVKVPFLYPVHDAPLDFQRWTGYGLNRKMVSNSALYSDIGMSLGTPPETGALILNIALVKLCLELIARKSLFALLLLPLLPLMVLVSNLAGAAMGYLSRDTQTMPFTICMVGRKKN